MTDISRRRVLTMTLVGATLTGVTTAGCAPDTRYGKVAPRLLTQEEAERLAVSRFNNYDRRRAPMTMSVMGSQQQQWLRGRIDFRDHVAYGNLQTHTSTDSYALLYWNFQSLAALGTQAATLPDQPPSSDAWRARPIDTNGEPFDIALVLGLNLAADRPENPLLLRQNGALWHGTTTVGDVAVDAFTGPGSDGAASDRLTYFVDAAARLRRVSATLPRGGGQVVVEFPDGDADEIVSPFTE